MFPMTPISVLDQMTRELHQTDHHAPPNRLDVQRAKLEHQTMYHLNTMSIELSRQEAELNLRDRQQIALATIDSTSNTRRLRTRIASMFFSLGNRIQPEDVSREPRFNA